MVLEKNLVFDSYLIHWFFYFISSYSSKYIYDFRLCFFPSLIYKKVKNPIIIVGNPRSVLPSTQILTLKSYRFRFSTFQLIYTSVTLQKIIKPLLPLERFSPTKYHSSDAHKTSLSSIETDDALCYLDFLMVFSYGFFDLVKDDLFN